MQTAQTYRDPLVEVLKHHLAEKQKVNKAFSLRSFSRLLGMDPSHLSKILKGQQAPGLELKKKIIKKLGLKAQDLLPKNFSRPTDIFYKGLDAATFSVISDWQHYAILELIKLDGMNSVGQESAMAKSLGLTASRFRSSLKRLLKLDLVRIENDRYMNAEDTSSSILNIPTSKAHKKHQEQILRQALKALYQVESDRRSQTSMTMAIDKAKVPEAIQMISDFRRSFSRFLTADSGLTDVYQISLSFFPITNNPGDMS